MISSASPIDIKLFNENDPLQFRLVFDKYAQSLLAYVQDLTHDVGHSEDVISGVFDRVWHKSDKDFKNEANLYAYLKTSVRNGSIDHLRRDGRAPVTHLKDHHLDYQEYTPEMDLDRAEVRSIVFPLIEALDPLQKKILKMAYIEGMTDVQIAHTLAMTKRKVGYHREKGLRALEKKMPPGAKDLLPLIILLYGSWIN